MKQPIRILLQTTIPETPDDWSIARFGLLREHLENLKDDEGRPLYRMDARDRATADGPDPVLSTLDTSDYDELWLFAVDTGNGLHADDCDAISRFNQRGGGMLIARDHMDLGSSVCTLDRIGCAHHFHTKNPEEHLDRRCIDDVVTNYILWPNYHSGANGDFQNLHVEGERHELLSGPVDYLPSHPHEGAVSAPLDDPNARVIASGRSQVTGRAFNLAVAFEAENGRGRGVAESTFHHFCDYNWDPTRGCPSFVSEAPGHALADFPPARASVERYVRNLALWLAGRSVQQ
jgi:hypothetical protein